MGEISIDENLSFVESIFNKNEVEDEIEFMENKELLKKLFSTLDIKYKEIFILRFDEEKSYEEISTILKIPKSSVGTLISRAKNKLQKEYKKLTT
jgi:RNA polymerase sigma-70 factor (ECF subfamily)